MFKYKKNFYFDVIINDRFSANISNGDTVLLVSSMGSEEKRIFTKMNNEMCMLSGIRFHIKHLIDYLDKTNQKLIKLVS